MQKEEIDRMLLKLFRRWRSSVHLSRAEKQQMHWLEEFCSYAWDQLEEFERRGRLKRLRP